jgi:hypothetical protein
MTEMEQVKDEVMLQVLAAPSHRIQPQQVELVLAEQLDVPRSAIKDAVRDLIDAGELKFAHRDPLDYLEIAPVEPHHAARPMEVVVDGHGERWLCDEGVDRSRDLSEQGCWLCGSLAFTRDD